MAEPGMGMGGPHVAIEAALGYGRHWWSWGPDADAECEQPGTGHGERYGFMLRDADELMVSIEPATEGDWPWIVQGQVGIAWTRLGRERRKAESRQAIAERVARQVERLRHDEGFPSQAFVARPPHGTPVGFVWVAKTHNDTTGRMEASLLNQYVAKPYRSRGLGQRLMETAEEWAREQGLPRVSLSVAMRNTMGQRLYRSLGYEVETLRMTKKLIDEPEEELRLDIY